MPTPGREVQAECFGTFYASRDSSNSLLGRHRRLPGSESPPVSRFARSVDLVRPPAMTRRRFKLVRGMRATDSQGSVTLLKGLAELGLTNPN